MRISNILWRAAMLCGCGIALPLSADDLALADGISRLTGTVLSIDAEGRLELVSPLSPDPLVLKEGSVEKVEFSSIGSSPEPPAALVELANGDILPATIEHLDDQTLTVNSPDAGRLEIPRNLVSSAQFGIQRHDVIYSGPRSPDDWTGQWGEPKNWSLRGGSLVAKGPATAARKFALPRQFVLRFTFKWQAKQTPKFQVYFADPLSSAEQACDRYYLRFGGAGLEIKREATQGKRDNTLLQLNRTPNQYPDRQLRVEIRVDRNGSRLQLFLNGEPEAEFADPISPVPDGSGITLVCNARDGSEQEIRDIEISEYDDSQARHRSEDRGDPANDSLISRDDDRWGGHLMEIRKTGDGPLFRFKSDFQDDPLEIPEADVSTVFFAAKDTLAAANREAPFMIQLLGGGSLKVNSCQFTESTVSAAHPLLGPLELRRDGIVSMQRANRKPEPSPQP